MILLDHDQPFGSMLAFVLCVTALLMRATGFLGQLFRKEA
jgi:hypothetical protein